MGLGKTLTMLMAIASSKKASERYGETYVQDQRKLCPTKGTLVVVTSRLKLSGSSVSSVPNTDVKTCIRGFRSVED